MDCVELVGRAASCFARDADASCLACFRADVTVYAQPGRAVRPIARSRAELEQLLVRTRRRYPDLTVHVSDVEGHAGGVTCDVIVESGGASPDVWRFALAVGCGDDLIGEVRSFWERDAAAEWLLGND